jgi:hypothetical protein
MPTNIVANDGAISKNAVLRLIKKFLPGAHNTIPIPLELVRLLGNYEEAAIFSQCMYWSERTVNRDGWFWKRYSDWDDELAIKEKTCRRRLRSLEDRGWVEVVVKKHNGVRALHVRVLEDNFINALTEAFLNPEAPGTIGNGQNGSLAKQPDCPVGQTAKMAVSSITETTSKNYPQETTVKLTTSTDKGATPPCPPLLENDLGHEGGSTAHDQPIPVKPQDQTPGTTKGSRPERRSAAPPAQKTFWEPENGLAVDDKGWVKLPPASEVWPSNRKRVGAAKLSAMRQTQEWLVNQGIKDIEFVEMDNGEFWLEHLDCHDGPEHPDKAFGKGGALSLRKLRTLAYDQDAITQGEFNNALEYFFWQAWNGSTTIAS